MVVFCQFVKQRFFYKMPPEKDSKGFSGGGFNLKQHLGDFWVLPIFFANAVAKTPLETGAKARTELQQRKQG